MSEGIVFIYNDYGSSSFSVDEMTNCFVKCFPDKFKVEHINAEKIISGHLMQCLTNSGPSHKVFLCIGGGFDLGYLKALSTHGPAQIRSFVEAGGNYVGICAGAYFACYSIEFDRNGPLEVMGDRPLKFFPGKAIGPINKKYQYENSDDQAQVCKIELLFDGSKNRTFSCYQNGGCFFESCCTETADCGECIAKYLDLDVKGKWVIVQCRIGKGTCLLSGVHFEFDTARLDQNNQNLRDNVIPFLKTSSMQSGRHSNEELIRLLFEKVFNI